MANPKLATLSGGFTGAVLDPNLWYVEPDAGSGNPSAVVTVEGGTLIIDGGDYSDASYYGSVNAQDVYDLTGSRGFCRVIPDTASADNDTGWGLWDDTFSNGITTGVTGGNFYVQSWDASVATTLYSAPYDLAGDAWMMISEHEGVITCSTSRDGLTWTSRYTTATETFGTWTAPNSSVQLYYGSASGTAKPAGAGWFRAFNVTPAPPGIAALTVAVT